MMLVSNIWYKNTPKISLIHYTVLKYWTGGLYCGISLKWDYSNTHVDLSMPGYIKDAMHKYQQPTPKK
jgi:hypothetical protein